MIRAYLTLLGRTCTVMLCIVCSYSWSTREAFSQDNLNKSILYINSYHNGYQWSDGILDGIRDRLGQSRYKIDLQIEYMDAKKFNKRPVISEILDLFHAKFSNEDFDVIIVSDDDAFNFAVKYRQVLFPDTAIVFCGVNDLNTNEIDVANFTGVVESFELGKTIEIALQLHPQKNRMIVVGDSSTAGLAIKKQIENIVPTYKNRLEVDYWVQVELDELQQRVKQLSDNSFLFFIPYYQIIGNHFYTAEEVMESISSYSNVPLYTAWEFLLGHGAVGGSVLSGFDHGQLAAKMALDILDGTAADSISIKYEPSGLYIFDYNLMQRLGISENSLPPNSKIINAPDPFYELPRELFWTIIVSFILLLFVLVFLIGNIFARRRVEKRIKDQLTFQETLIDTIPQLVSWKDARGRYVGANLTFVNFFGLQEIAEVVAKKTRDVVFDQDYVDWSIETDKVVVSGAQAFRKIRKRLVDESGEVSWLELNKVPLRDQNGRITGVLTTAENVTREHNLEKQLLQSQKMEAIGTLAGGIAHDFNNILTSIINSTELAIGDIPGDTQTSKDLERVLKAAHRGGRVVKQILTFSRPSQEGFRATDLKQVIAEVIALMEVSLPGNIIMRSYVAPGIRRIYADPTQIHQAIMNLCTNAFHELREHGGEIQLRLEEALLESEEAAYMELAAGNYVRITVKDNGPGISPEAIDKVFDPFYSSKDKSEGTGLGLTVVLGITKSHLGGVRVQSLPGEGATFEIYLPKVEADPLPDVLASKTEAPREAHILFVEDDKDQLLTVPRILEKLGYQVTARGDSSEALDLFIRQEQYFDLLITDFDMPNLNGIELVNEIIQINETLPVIMISGREDAVGLAESIDNIKKVFLKPYRQDELAGLIFTTLFE